MASEIRVDKINSLSGVGTVTLSPTGVDIAGITTAATLRATTGIVTSLTAVSSAKVGSGVTLSPDGDIFATGVTTSTTFVGALTGNVTGNVSGSSGSATGNAGGLTGTPNISCGTIAGSTGTFTGDVDIADKIVHTGDTNTAIRFPAADTITAETDGTERYRITSDGKFVGGPLANGHSTARCAAGGLDLRAGQGGAGFPSIKIGADSGTANATTLSSSTRKQARIGCASYHNSYDFATFLYFDSDSSTNELNIGGGTGHGYAATNISLWTAANNTTSTGSERIRIHSGGTVNIPAGITLGESVSSTAASNTLDDYEEGTWTPDWRGASALGTTSYGSYNAASYVKVGNQVTVRGHSSITGSSGGSGFWFIMNLPFTNGGGDNRRYRSVGSVMIEDFNFNSDVTDVICFLERNINHMQLRSNRDDASAGSNISVNTDTSFDIMWTLTYQTV